MFQYLSSSKRIDFNIAVVGNWIYSIRMDNELDERAKIFAQYVGAEIKGAMVTRGYSQGKVADALGHSRASFTHWLKGEPSIPVEVAQKICEYIGVDLKVLVDRANQRLISEKGEYGQSSDSDDATTRDYYSMAAKHGDIEAEQEAYEEMP